LLAAGSSGFKVRVYSGYVKEVEEKPSATPWGTKMPFQNMMAEFNNSPNGGGWIHSVNFSGDGNRLAWVAHDASISIADATKGESPSFTVYRLATNQLPLLSCIWLSPTTIVAGGHGCMPLVYKVDDTAEEITFMASLESAKDGSGAKKVTAMDRFKQMDTLGSAETKSTELKSTHQNQISCTAHLLKAPLIFAKSISLEKRNQWVSNSLFRNFGSDRYLQAGKSIPGLLQVPPV